MNSPPRITQRYGARPEYYKQFGLEGHEGTDFGGVSGDPVYAAADGVVKLIAKDDGKHPYGSHIRMTHPHGSDTWETIYAHLRGFVVDLMVGSAVKAGQQIGYLGSTGNSSGPHLHFSLKRNGVIVNPEPYLNV